MISDPIIGNDIPNAFQTFKSATGRFSTLRLTDANSGSLWSIGKWERGVLGVTKKHWVSPIGFVKPEEFMEMLIVRYPDHFEWILFHPEWL